MDTSDCPVALEPSIFHNQGAAERERFLAGAARRNELALVVAMIGDVSDDAPRSALFSGDSSVIVDGLYTSVAGRRLPTGSRPAIAEALDPPDRDLAIRLLSRPADAPWWSLKLHGATTYRGDGYGGPTTYEATGRLHPILIDALGDPVVAAWTSPSGDQRYYIIPDATDWSTILDWLVQRALPAYVPSALRRARSPYFIDPDLQTTQEATARQALTDLEDRFAEARAVLEVELQQAEMAAEPIRYGLLYGSGPDLVAAVQSVLAAAGLTAVDVDAMLGATKSADLLVSDGRQRRLVEIKAIGGAAQEAFVATVQRHLATWPQLRPGDPVDGGALIVNHHQKLAPADRSRAVYVRPEFAASLTIPVISTIQLFDWWRSSDWKSIREALFGSTTPTRHGAPASPATVPSSRRSRWWQRDT